MDFHFKKFTLSHDHSTMKIGTDAVLLAALTNPHSAQSLIDIGCGCGVIAFCIAQKMAHTQPNATIYGIDTDQDSIEEANHNKLNYGLLNPNCFHFKHISLQDWTQQEQLPTFDLIVSNPPFFNGDLKPTDAARLKSKHRDNQLSFDDLIYGIDRLLSNNGRFTIILPVTEAIDFQKLAATKFSLSRKILIRPTAKKPPHRVVLEYTRLATPLTQESSLTIRDAENNYTTEYLQLVKPYLSIQ